MREPISSPVAATPGTAFPDGRSLRDERSLDVGVAKAAFGEMPTEAKDALLASIEARLAQEVRGLIGSLDQFSRRTQLIGELLPDDANFCKAVTGFLGLLSLQFAYSLGKGLDKPVFLDDGAQYLRELNLSLDDLVREVSLEGRRFLAVALVEQSSADVLGSAEGGGK